MATSIKVQWDVRTTGNDLNGGGFLLGATGIDYSASDTPHVTFDGATIYATSAGTGLTITIVGYTVSANDVGNVLNVASGTNFNTGLYEIASVNTGANTWTVVAGANITTGAGAAMVGRMGGGFVTVQKALTNWGGSGATSTDEGSQIHIKLGTYTLTTVLTDSGANSTGSTAIITGYQTSHNDEPIGANRPTITTATNSTRILNYSKGNRFIKNIIFSNTAGTRDSGIYATVDLFPIAIYNCVFDGFTYGVNINYATTGSGATDVAIIHNNEFMNCATRAIIMDWSCSIVNNYFHSNGTSAGTSAIDIGSDRDACVQSIENNVFYANRNAIIGVVGANANRMIVIRNNSISDSVETGITIAGATNNNLVITGNILYNNGTYGVSCAGALSKFLINGYNAYGANTTAPRLILPVGVGDVALTVDPFVARTGGDFALNNTAGGGAACKGLIGSIPNAGSGFQDVGALQSNAGGGGGSGMLYIPNMEGS